MHSPVVIMTLTMTCLLIEGPDTMSWQQERERERERERECVCALVCGVKCKEKWHRTPTLPGQMESALVREWGLYLVRPLRRKSILGWDGRWECRINLPAAKRM